MRSSSWYAAAVGQLGGAELGDLHVELGMHVAILRD